MPILAKEVDLFPANLLELADVAGESSDTRWWALYTRSRQEKQLMRRLVVLDIPFYGPLVERRYRSPNGRVRTSYEPLLSNYVFMRGDFANRHASLTTNCVSQCYEVKDCARLLADLKTIARLIDTGEPITPETQLKAGDRVRIKTGVFAGFEGTILRRDKETRLLVGVKFAQQGASVLLDDCQLDLL